MTDTAELRRTPLTDCHEELGAKMVAFAGWNMPVRYGQLTDEHRAVRQAAGIFDVSHMGEIRVTGHASATFLDRMTPNHVAKLRPGRAHYSGLLTESGTYLDDLLVYRLGQDEFLLVVNASNAQADFDHLMAHSEGDEVELVEVSDQYALLALQGPAAVPILTPLCGADLGKIRYYRFVQTEVAGCPVLLSRTGYTGEDGFELYLPAEHGPAVWRHLLEAGAGHGLVPAGLGARDTLRLEAGMALYGNDIDKTTTPFEAGLGWTIKLNPEKGEFVGSAALRKQKAQGPHRRLAGFEVVGRGIARQGCAVLSGDQEVGKVTSGTWSPTFEKALGMAYLPTELAQTGTDLEIDVRGRQLPAKVVDLPFYKRPQ